MIAILLLGLFLGMRHALEADHVAAVASLTLGSKSPRHSLLQGAVWGIGHAATLLVVGTFAMLTQAGIGTTTAAVLEGCVGMMLVVLGLDVARRMVCGRVHLHVHEHHGGVRHFHAHVHTALTALHEHEPAAGEPHGFPKRALFIGLMHGLAGSAALMLLALRTTESIGMALLYTGVFGLGSMLGMALLSAVIAVPINYSARHMRRAQYGMQCALGFANIGLGAYVVIAAYAAA